MSISLFTRELLQLKDPLENQVARFVGVFTIYIRAYYFLTNKDIELFFSYIINNVKTYTFSTFWAYYFLTNKDIELIFF